jgi:hypothetical protein
MIYAVGVLLDLQQSTLEGLIDYLHLWRLVGHYVGVEDSLNPCTSWVWAEVAFRSYMKDQVNNLIQTY